MYAAETPVLWLVAAVVLLLPLDGWAQLPAARLHTIFPPGAKVGSQIEVKLDGIDLDDVTQLHFDNPDIRSQTTGEPGRLIVQVAADVPPGIHEVRAVGRFGISNARAFVVGDRPEIVAPQPRNSPDTAAPLALGTTVNAQCSASADDYFRFAARRGQRVLIECVSDSIDSRMDPVLTLYDSEGRERGHSRHGGLIDCTAAADGRYLLKVHDVLYRGGSEFFYRLTAGAGPHIDFIFPQAGVPATKSTFTLYGRNLPDGTSAALNAADGAPLEKLEVEIEVPARSVPRPNSPVLSLPSALSLDGFEYRLQAAHGASNAIPIAFVQGPLVIEQKSHDSADRAQKLAIPCEVAGRFYPQGSRDWFTFDAKKGDIYWIEVFSHRLGFNTKPFLLVQRVVKDDQAGERTADLQEIYDSPENIGGAEFRTTNRDPVVRFEAREDGTYRLQVRDLFSGSHDDPSLAYVLSIGPPQPDFRLAALFEAPPPVRTEQAVAAVWSGLLRPAGAVPLKVIAIRRDGFAGEIELRAEGLPPGVHCEPSHIAAATNSAVLVLTADETAPVWAGPVRVTGRARIGQDQVMHDALAGEVTWTMEKPESPSRSRIARDIALGVCGDTAPLSVRAGDGKPIETLSAGKIKVPVTLVRRGEFKGSVKLRAHGLPTQNKPTEFDLPAGADSATYELDLGPYRLPPGTYTFCIEAETRGNYVRNNQLGGREVVAAFYSNPVVLHVAENHK